jgi:hypothetical protein
METEGFLDPAAVAAGSEAHVAAAGQPVRDRRRAGGSADVDGRLGVAVGRTRADAAETEGYDAGVPVLDAGGEGPQGEPSGG